jgi:hypothetical protein
VPDIEEGQHVQVSQEDGVDGEQVTGDDPGRLRPGGTAAMTARLGAARRGD